MLSEATQKMITLFQKIEITEHHVYKLLAKKAAGKNKEVLTKIANDELRHFEFWSKYSGKTIKPNRLTILKFLIIAKIFGLTFTIKMMEKGEEEAEKNYASVLNEIPEAEQIMNEEYEHEKMLVDMIDERKIDYIGSMVLGLNDALVELTGALAGLSLALQSTRLIGLAGLITGIAASLSMASSEYLSKKSEGEQSPIIASFYTGIAYIFTVLLLVGPFFFFNHYLVALGNTILFVILIIWFFSFFVSVVKDFDFKRTFLEMIFISLGVAAISFLIGLLARKLLGIDVG